MRSVAPSETKLRVDTWLGWSILPCSHTHLGDTQPSPLFLLMCAQMWAFCSYRWRKIKGSGKYGSGHWQNPAQESIVVPIKVNTELRSGQKPIVSQLVNTTSLSSLLNYSLKRNILKCLAMSRSLLDLIQIHPHGCLSHLSLRQRTWRSPMILRSQYGSLTRLMVAI